MADPQRPVQKNPRRTGGGNAPPAPPPPPTTVAKGGAYQQYINKHPKLRRYSQVIYQAALAEGLDPVYFAALINIEYVPGPGGVPKHSSVGAIGPAQIMPLHVGTYAPWLGRKVTQQDLDNPKTNIRFGAWYFSKALAAHGGDYDAAYRGYGPGDASVTYNKGYSGASPFSTIPNTYVATGGSSPEDKAGQAARQKAAADKLAASQVAQQAFQQNWHGVIDPIYEAYTGQRATKKQAQQAIDNGWSTYHLQTVLANGPNFTKSPVWKQNAPGYVAAWRAVYGNQKVDRDAIRYGIIHNLGGDGFHELLRERTDYVKSNEFKQAAVTMTAAYEQIYGRADENAANVIKQATLGGWSPDQFQAYLRKLPEYSFTPEYHAKATTFLDAIGLITGRVPTMTDAQPGSPGTATDTIGPGHSFTAPASTPATGLPNDPRVKTPTTPRPVGKPASVKML